MLYKSYHTHKHDRKCNDNHQVNNTLTDYNYGHTATTTSTTCDKYTYKIAGTTTPT